MKAGNKFLWLISLCTGISLSAVGQAITFDRDFAPADGFIKPMERPYRDDTSLNGSWKFLPVYNAEEQTKEKLLHPVVPVKPAWEKAPVKIPSPWNVNSFAKGNGGDFITYPSYPTQWSTVRAGWLMHTIPYHNNWKDKRVVLHFEAIAGYAQVYVNKKKVGENADLFLPFEIDITDAMEANTTNELLVWVADASLFNEPGKVGNRIHVAGSFWGQHAIGIWQDVYVVVKPAVHIQHVFIKPFLERDELEIEAEVVNASNKSQQLSISGSIMPWINQTGKTIKEIPEVKWTLGAEAIALPGNKITLQPASTNKIQLKIKVDEKLRKWTTETPNLYGMVLSLHNKKQVIDKKYERFGWRQFSIVGEKFYLNGKQIILKADSWHFMGIPQMTRRYAWAWYKTLQDCQANAVRLHAQPYPAFYLDMADEMGICVLDETGMWASDGGPKADAPAYWRNCDDHLQRLILRDRNHPSVFGWSVCNENLPVVINVQRAPDSIIKRQVDAINQWVRICRTLDPTRNWISGDGETNLPTDLPTVIGHYGHENEMKNWSSQGKLWGIGEQGMAYAGTPREASKFIGDRAYESQWGRMEGVAEEARQLLNLQKKYKASISSIFNLVWYGLQPLALGLKDTTQPPAITDGIFFNAFQEGKPGVQPERLGPYTTTFNPGYDPSLPLYQAWPLYDAIRAGFSDSDRASQSIKSTPTENVADASSTSPSMHQAMLLSADPDSVLFHLLHSMGLELQKVFSVKKRVLLIIDGKHPPVDKKALAIQSTVLQNGGTVLIWGIQPGSVNAVNAFLPAPVTLTERKASSFLTTHHSPLLNGLGNADFYLTEKANGTVMQYGLTGDLVSKGKILLAACNTDWATWNHRPESIKTAAVVRSEREAKPAGNALIEAEAGNGKIYLFAIEPEVFSKSSAAVLRRLFLNLGVGFNNTLSKDVTAFTSDGVLQHALVLGAFGGEGKTMTEISRINFLEGSSKENYIPGQQIRNRFWETASSNDGIFDFNKMGLRGPTENAVAYVSFWVHSPRSLTDLLIEPDMPQLNMLIGADDAFQVYLNQQLIRESIKEGGLQRREQTIKALPLQKGWNHFLIKVIQKGGDWKLAVELTSNQKDFLKKIQSQVAVK